MQILTRNEAAHRAGILDVLAIDVTVDLSGAQDSSQATYPVTSILTLTSCEERTFIDIVGQVSDVFLNGVEHPNAPGIVCARATSGAFDERKRQVSIATYEPGQLPLHGM